MSQRFPPGLKYLVNYDTTTFVSDTIHDVLITLLMAFVLVVIVVFLFLGNLRATIIPAIAVPVSLIGSFAVLLAMGYSANTISLLAMVLAIGIVVDDAIVVVENVERVHGGGAGTVAGGGDQEGDGADHRADHRHHAGAAVGVRADRLHSRHFRNAVPAVRRDDQRRDADLGVERADPVAGAVRACSCATRAASAASWAGCCGGIDNVRDGYAAVVRRLVRVAALSLVLMLASARPAIFGAVVAHADRLPARGGPGRLLRLGAVAGRRLGRPHQRDGAAQVEALLRSMPQVAEHLRDRRLFDARRRQRAERRPSWCRR